MDNITEFKKEGFDRQKLFRLPRRAEKRAITRAFTADCLVTDVGYYPEAQGHLVTRSDGIGCHILIFCLSGRGWFSTGAKRREVKAGEAFWLPPETPHRYGAHRSEPWEIYWVHARGKGIDQLLEWTPFSHRRHLNRISNSQAIKRQFNSLLQRLERGYSDHTLLEMSRFFVTLSSLLHHEGGSNQELLQKEKIESTMDKMRKTLSEDFDLEHYACEAGFSVSQFSHLFKRHYGTSPMAYLTELRMQRARELLENTPLSVKEIAAELGYNDPLYFSRQFKKVVGSAPSQYRIG